MHQFAKDVVYSIKLVNGDEVVAKFESSEGPRHSFYKPVILVLTPQGPQYAPILFSAQVDSMVIDDHAIMYKHETKEDARLHYIKATTGLEVPQKKIITG